MGELDIASAEEALRRVAEAERAAPSLLVIDLSTLTFVDSSGVRVVLVADDHARAAGRRLAIRLGRGPALRVFTALGLVDRFRGARPTREDPSPRPGRGLMPARAVRAERGGRTCRRCRAASPPRGAS
jgi:anti-anti-sigma factor